MIATRILKPESMIMGEPHCLIVTAPVIGVHWYYYFEPISIDSYRVYYNKYDKHKQKDDLSVNVFFHDITVEVYKLEGSFPKKWFSDLKHEPGRVRRAFHLENS